MLEEPGIHAADAPVWLREETYRRKFKNVSKKKYILNFQRYIMFKGKEDYYGY